MISYTEKIIRYAVVPWRSADGVETSFSSKKNAMPQDEIDDCLNCVRSECINCKDTAEMNKKKRRTKQVELQITIGGFDK